MLLPETVVLLPLSLIDGPFELRKSRLAQRAQLEKVPDL
jgi:hypothetical protein